MAGPHVPYNLLYTPPKQFTLKEEQLSTYGTLFVYVLPPEGLKFTFLFLTSVDASGDVTRYRVARVARTALSHFQRQ